RRRKLQMDYNREHGIEPQTIRKAVTDIIQSVVAESGKLYRPREHSDAIKRIPREELEALVLAIEEEMRAAAERLDFEQAALLRDEVFELRKDLDAFAGIKKPSLRVVK
ncbi:UvrB/UvrC motif-containing protein, partial [Candidatus Aquicultor secundus]